MSRTSGSIVGKDLAANATTGIFTVQQALTKKAAGNWPASSGWGQYQISRSLRFNSADSAYLSRTPASAGNRKTWTWSGWVKFSIPASAYYPLFSAMASTAYIELSTDYKITFRFSSGDSVRTDMVFRDPSAWYHLVFVADTTQATDTNRLKAYVNGVQVSLTPNLTWPSLNEDGGINTTVSHTIGADVGNSNYQNGYMTEIHFIDGQALTPSSFGETDATTGVWKPKFYTGTYGTNGFHLDFSDNSSTTALGYDAAGSNDWTANNFSVTAGAGNDSLVDTPTPYDEDTGAGGEVRGNYCTLNPLSNGTGTAPKNGNLNLAVSGATATRCNSTIAVNSGKWYFEVLLVTAATSTPRTQVGIGQNYLTTTYPGGDALSYSFALDYGAIYNNNTETTGYGSVLTNGDIFMCAFDLDNNKIFFGKNGTWYNSSNPATGTNPAFTLTAGTYCPIARPRNADGTNTPEIACNFGQRPFAYTAPSGFKALCTTNLPDPTVVQGNDYFNTVLYTGNGSTQSITGVGFQPDFVWAKARNSAENHALNDAIRGAGYNLESNLTGAESFGADRLSSFDSDGFSLGGGALSWNYLNYTYVTWNWNAGGSNATNTDGTITSTVRANPTAGFSIVSYTGVGPGSAANEIEVGHGLGAIPKMVIVKVRSTTGNWFVFTTVIDGSNDFLYLNTTDSAGNSGNTPPTSDVFYAGGALNYSGETYIAYCFAEIPGFSKFGSYTGNGSADGPFVYCGFRPAWLLVKRSSVAGNYWVLTDTARGTYNVMGPELYPNASDAEAAGTKFDYLSNGFKLRSNAAAVNNSTDTYIFMAFAENPFKYSLAR